VIRWIGSALLVGFAIAMIIVFFPVIIMGFETIMNEFHSQVEKPDTGPT